MARGVSIYEGIWSLELDATLSLVLHGLALSDVEEDFGVNNYDVVSDNVHKAGPLC